MKSNRFIGGMGERLGLVEWHRILSDLKCCWLAMKVSSKNRGGHGQKFFIRKESS